MSETILQQSNSDNNTNDRELDARGLNCPLPILRCKKTLSEMRAGEVLSVVSTDPGSVEDFAAFAEQSGNQLLASCETNGEFHFRLRKSA